MGQVFLQVMYVPFICVLSLWGLWVFYLAWTHLEKIEAAGLASKVTSALGCPVRFIGLTIDIFVNLTWMTILYLDMPRELLVTTRMIRYMKGRDGWRKTATKWASKHLLDAFDIEGEHLKF